MNWFINYVKVFVENTFVLLIHLAIAVAISNLFTSLDLFNKCKAT